MTISPSESKAAYAEMMKRKLEAGCGSGNLLVEVEAEAEMF